jgi:two-component system, response regulator PdtaR
MPLEEPKIILLLVEDEALLRMHGVDILEDAGFIVIEACNADEALIILDNHHEIRLIFSDIDMPGSMDGMELMELAHLRWPEIRLLLTSGHRRLEHAALPGQGKFLRKPWSEEALVDKVWSVLAA